MRLVSPPNEENTLRRSENRKRSLWRNGLFFPVIPAVVFSWQVARVDFGWRIALGRGIAGMTWDPTGKEKSANGFPLLHFYVCSLDQRPCILIS